jgi:hypothetical protein
LKKVPSDRLHVFSAIGLYNTTQDIMNMGMVIEFSGGGMHRRRGNSAAAPCRYSQTL